MSAAHQTRQLFQLRKQQQALQRKGAETALRWNDAIKQARTWKRRALIIASSGGVVILALAAALALTRCG